MKLDLVTLEVIDFGKYKGGRWNEVPLDYLKWLSNEASSEYQKRARNEIERRTNEVLKSENGRILK